MDDHDQGQDQGGKRPRKRPARESPPASQPSKAARSESAAAPNAPAVSADIDKLEPLWSSLRLAMSKLKDREEACQADAYQARSVQAKDLYVAIADVIVKKQAVITAAGRDGESIYETTGFFAEQKLREHPSYAIDRTIILYKLIRADLEDKGIDVDKEAEAHLAAVPEFTKGQVDEALKCIRAKDTPYDKLENIHDYVDELRTVMACKRLPSLPKDVEGLARELKAVCADIARGKALSALLAPKSPAPEICTLSSRQLYLSGQIPIEPARFVANRIRTCESIVRNLRKSECKEEDVQLIAEAAGTFLEQRAAVFRVSTEIVRETLNDITEKVLNTSPTQGKEPKASIPA